MRSELFLTRLFKLKQHRRTSAMTHPLSRLGAAALVASACAMLPGSLCAQTRSDFNGIWGGGVAQLTPTTCKTSIDAFPPPNGDHPFKATAPTATHHHLTFA